MSYYRGNFQGIGRMLQQPGIRKALEDKANEMRPVAVGISPVGDPRTDPHSGEYRDSWTVVTGDKRVKFHGVSRPRPYARLLNTSTHAVDVEYGTIRVPRHAVLRKTLDIFKAANNAA